MSTNQMCEYCGHELKRFADSPGLGCRRPVCQVQRKFFTGVFVCGYCQGKDVNCKYCKLYNTPDDKSSD